MSYQVIARKYRPQRFADVVGQEHVSQTLANAITQNRIAHAYLFCGPRGTGKTTIARIFAKCLNSTGGPKVDFTEDDPRCKEIAEGRSLDVLEIDGASNNGVEQVRDLRETCKYAPATSKFKIYIIDEVHMLSTAAFNALLKTLEEPPEHVKFMFATTEPEKVLPTILSRCQRFDLRRIPASLIVQHLKHIALQEKVRIGEEALHAIARGADGGMRDAESTLDQLISFCGDKIEESDVLSMFGLAARSQLLALAGAVLSGEIETALRELNDLATKGKDLGRLLADLLNHFRNLLIYQVSRGDLRLLETSEAEAAALKEQSSTVDTHALTRIMEVLTDGEGRLRDATSKKILIEVVLLKAIQVRSAVSLDEVLARLQQLRSDAGPAAPRSAPEPETAAPAPAKSPFAALREAVGQSAAEGKPAQPAPAGKPTAAPARPPAQPPTTVSSDLEALWPQLLDAVGRASPFTKSYLLEAHPVSLAGNVLTIGFDPEFADHLGLVDNTKTHDILRTKLLELGLANTMVKFIQAEAPPNHVRPAGPVLTSASDSAPPPAAKPEAAADNGRKPKPKAGPIDMDEFKNDPLIKKALELFKGQIVDVRA